MSPTATRTPSAPGVDSKLVDALRQATSLSSSLLQARSASDLRRLAVSAGVVIGGGPSAILTYDPLQPDLRIDEAEGVSRIRAQAFRFVHGEGFVTEIFERASALQNPVALEQSLIAELGFVRPIIVPLAAGGRLRGVFAADARPGPGIGAASTEMLPFTLRQTGAVIAGALAALEANGGGGLSGSLASRDPVTGLADRRAAEAHLRHELSRAKRYREPLSLVMLDVDSFDQLNEAHSYQAGDRILKEVGELLVGGAAAGGDLALCFRESDLAARWGADSFLVLLPSTPQSGAQLAAERFLAGLRQRRRDVSGDSDSGSSVAVTATAAVVTFPDDGVDEAPLLALVERLVADGAQAGGDRLVLAQPPRSVSGA